MTKPSLKKLARGVGFFAAAFLLSCALVTPGAHAYVFDDDLPDLSNRYELLQELAGKSTEGESIVVSTRVGVLTAVNRALNGAAVSFNAEAIGDILNADAKHKWVNVLGSDGAQIGVYMKKRDAKKIERLGSYKQKGTTLYIEGTYSIACSSHEGELDVHADRVKVKKEGKDLKHKVSKRHVVFGCGMTAMSFALVWTFFKLRKARARRKSLEELCR